MAIYKIITELNDTWLSEDLKTDVAKYAFKKNTSFELTDDEFGVYIECETQPSDFETCGMKVKFEGV